MDWLTFKFEYTLDLMRAWNHLIPIEAYKEAALNLILPPDWKEQLDRLNRVRAVHGTTALEGNPLSEAEVSHQMEILEEEGVSVGTGKTTREQLQIRNAGRAQAWVRERFHPNGPPLGLGDILELHRMITEHSDITNNVPGRLRTFPVQVGSPDVGGVHKGAPHADLPKLMEEYINFVNSRKSRSQHPVIRALLSHCFLVTLHPFGDGNGRVSRLVEAGILFEGGYNIHGFYGLSNYFYRNDHKYKTLLQESRQRSPFDVTEFALFGLEGYSKELKGINNFIKTKLNRVVYRTVLVRAFNKRVGNRRRLLNQREWTLLEFLISETEPNDPFSDNPTKTINFSELRESNFIQASYRDVTPRTFYRELIRLGELGFIKFTRAGDSKDWIVELDFGAIGKY